MPIFSRYAKESYAFNVVEVNTVGDPLVNTVGESNSIDVSGEYGKALSRYAPTPPPFPSIVNGIGNILHALLNNIVPPE